MSTVKEIIDQKGSEVHTIAASATVVEAVKKMNEHRIGSLATTREDGSVGGIITECDVLRHIGNDLEHFGQALVDDVMTHEVIACAPSTLLNDVRSIMKNHRIRHVPVVHESGRIIGMVSIGDINAHLIDEDEVTINHLHEYINGRV